MFRASRIDARVLRLMLVTDGAGDPQRVTSIVEAAVHGGVRCVQLREAKWSARHLMHACERLLPVLDRVDGVLLVNDRVDVAAAGLCHGALLGHRSLPPELARQVVGSRALLGYSAHDRGELDLAVASDCDFALLSPVWPTSSKPGAPHLGALRAAQLTATARLPVLWLGGIDAARAATIVEVPSAGRPAGIAVRSAIMAADDPAAAAAALLGATSPVP